jgi:hypothetical protein
MRFSASLLERDGTPVGRITDRDVGLSVSGGIDIGRTAQLPVWFDDPLTRDDPTTNGGFFPINRLIRIMLDGDYLFNGPILLPEENWSERKTQLTCVGPHWFLQQSEVNTRSDTIAPGQLQGNTTNGSVLVTGIPTTFLTANLDVLGPGIPSGAKINNIVSGTSFNLTVAATLTHTQQWLTFSRGIFLPQIQVAQWEIMYRLMEHVLPTAAETATGIPDHGVIRGTHPALGAAGSALRDREYVTGDQILSSIEEFNSVENGVEHVWRALSGAGGDLAALDTADRFGTDKSSTIVFQYGWGENNASDFSYKPPGDAVRNRGFVTGTAIEGEQQYVGIADQPDSELLHGILTAFGSDPSTIDPTLLSEVAQGLVAANAFPADYFEIVPALDDGTGYKRAQTGGWTKVQDQKFGVPPTFGPNKDYWEGDTIAVHARDKSGHIREVIGRVVEWTVTEADEFGNVLAALKCEPLVTMSGVVTP